MSDPRDPDEQARIQAQLDQGQMGLNEPEVVEAIQQFFEDCDTLARTLHEYLPVNAVNGMVGAFWALWLVDDYPEIYNDFVEDEEDWEWIPEPPDEQKSEGSLHWCPRCGAQFGLMDECPFDGTELERYTL